MNSTDFTKLPKVHRMYTFSFGEETRESREKEGYTRGQPGYISKSQLCLSSLTRGIDINQNADKIKEEYLSQLPDAEWQLDAIDAYAKLSRDAQNMIEDYVSYGYEITNTSLRHALADSSRKIPQNSGLYVIQQSIDKMPPLDKNIIVYRYVHRIKDYNIGDIDTFGGYLSTSFDDLMISERSCGYDDEMMRKPLIIMKIHVPKGTKALYIPSEETELIFSNNTQMKLIDKTKGFVCYKGDMDKPQDIHIRDDVSVYEWQML
jgi:hypothetical protein